jgi:hypothetical protein
MPSAFLWFPLLAIVAHLVEEFVWPGGFAEWYRHYPPGHVADVSSRFLVVVNVVFVGLALVPPILGATPRGYAYWTVVAMIAGANSVFHLLATIRTRVYSPGVITGTALYIPLALGGTMLLTREHLVAPATIVQAVLIAIAYSAWSSWRHRRHSSRVATA